MLQQRFMRAFKPRHYSTYPSQTRIITQQPRDVLDACLNQYISTSKTKDDLLPYNYHLLYFYNTYPESELATDGYDLFPSKDRNRRIMWNNGTIKFEKDNRMKIGQQVQCRIEEVENLEIASAKYGKLNKVMTKREFSNDNGISITELRGLTYLNGDTKFQSKEAKKEFNENGKVFKLKLSEFLLFRYSALTFNAHKIHWDKEYARFEGYRDCLVHGPLTVTLTLRLINNLLSANQFITSINYTLLYPLFVNENIKFNIKNKDDKMICTVYNSDNMLCAKSIIELK